MSFNLGPYQENQIYHGDSSELITKLPDNSIDLVITSPPYNTGKSAGGGFSSVSGPKWKNPPLKDGYDDHRDDMEWPAYIEWQREMIRQMWRVIKKTGAIYYNHKTRHFGGKLWTPLALLPGFTSENHIPGESFLSNEVILRDLVIWARAGGVNLKQRYYLPTSEWILLLAKEDFILQPGGCVYGDVWRINQEQNNPHPAPFPEKLVSRILESAIGWNPTEPKIILEPYCGSGTVPVVAQRMGINCLGFEKSELYIKQARLRLANSYLSPNF